MYRFSTCAVMVCALAVAATAAEETKPATRAAKNAGADALPAGMTKFNGMLIGRLQTKDVEKGDFTVKVDRVARVWRNSKAEDPKSCVGKVIHVDGVSGKWLDVLLLVKPGETLQFEARHDAGDKLTFPGEMLRKVAPVEPGSYPELPEDFRGFRGVVLGTITAKDDSMGELTLTVSKVASVAAENQAKRPDAVVGKPVIVAGFWGPRKDTLNQLEKGDTLEVGLHHISPRSEHVALVDPVRKVPAAAATTSDFPEGMHGFRGILVGQVVSTDTEKGVLLFKAKGVKKVWKQNKAEDLTSCQGKELEVVGIAGKWLDVLLVLKPGDEIEVEAFHNRGDRLDFVGEWLKKME